MQNLLKNIANNNSHMLRYNESNILDDAITLLDSGKKLPKMLANNVQQIMEKYS